AARADEREELARNRVQAIEAKPGGRVLREPEQVFREHVTDAAQRAPQQGPFVEAVGVEVPRADDYVRVLAALEKRRNQPRRLPGPGAERDEPGIAFAVAELDGREVIRARSARHGLVPNTKPRQLHGEPVELLRRAVARTVVGDEHVGIEAER